MDAIELYNAAEKALNANDPVAAKENLSKLAHAMENAMLTRGWHKFALTGDDTIDPLIERTNRNLTG